ncbi:MAG: c-type cytochrome, partial [Phycisphaerales bacterium]|nr:c-type cytochrome [Phycisphaerales bacterium]
SPGGSTGTSDPVSYVPPVVPGLSGRHPLDQRSVGEILIGELGCASCHPQIGGTSRKQAPTLDGVGARVSPEFLHRFIANPSAAQTGTTMPHLLGDQSPKKRAEIADAIAAFLISRSETAFERTPVEAADVESGRALFHTVGCVVCHQPQEAPPTGSTVQTRDGAIPLDHVGDKYSVTSLSSFIHQPLDVRHSGRMPDMQLNSAEARAIANYLLRDATPPTEPVATNPDLVEKGAMNVEQFRCASCHQIEGVKTPDPIDAPATLDPMRGCLADTPRGAPDFRLSGAQRDAIRQALATPDGGLPLDGQVALVMTRFNCIGCHTRDAYGGVSNLTDGYFTTSEENLGNDARIPPPLTEVGAKLEHEWMHRVLFDGANVRPYMHTRMPQFGEHNLGRLVALIEDADPAIPFDLPSLDGDEGRESRDAGQLLVGTDALACIVCHNFNGKDSPGFKGLDLITTTERLQPGWFARFLVEPQVVRPGLVMPMNWPGGVANRTDILEGETDAQIRAIWNYLAQGRTARDPVGIRAEPSLLEVGDQTRTYRGRSGIAGFRGVAVGFPNGLNYAFNANTGSLAGIWSGGFVRVRWDGQGAGDFTPLERAITFSNDVGLCHLDGDEAPWPPHPVMTEENPVNPDPDYPRNLGYRFLGYVLDADQIPTFRYRMGDVVVEDRLVPDGATTLVRTMTFTTPSPDTLFVRPLQGDVEARDDARFGVAGLDVVIPDVPSFVRADVLILRVDLPQGASSIEIRYDLAQ